MSATAATLAGTTVVQRTFQWSSPMTKGPGQCFWKMCSQMRGAHLCVIFQSTHTTSVQCIWEGMPGSLPRPDMGLVSLYIFWTSRCITEVKTTSKQFQACSIISQNEKNTIQHCTTLKLRTNIHTEKKLINTKWENFPSLSPFMLSVPKRYFQIIDKWKPCPFKHVDTRILIRPHVRRTSWWWGKQS